MRLFCWFCHKSVSNEVPNETVVRAICVCPECIQLKRVIIPEEKEDDK